MDKIKSHLMTAYMMFIFEFTDPTTTNSNDIPGKLEHLFDTQKSADRARRVMGKQGFKKAIGLYFNQFQSRNGLDYEALEKSIKANNKVMLRHLGKDKLMFLRLIISVFHNMEQPSPRRGLLFESRSA